MQDSLYESLLSHNTFGIAAHCRRLVAYESAEEAQRLARSLTPADGPLLIIGAGSNLLLTRDWSGTVVMAAQRSEARIVRDDGPEGNVWLKCWAGMTFDDVVALAVERGMHGMECLSLIPGHVGASAVQNIGAYGAEAADVIEEVEAVELATGNLVTLPAADCHYAYRQSRFKGEWKGKYLICAVTYRLTRQWTPQTAYAGISARLAAHGISAPTAQDVRDVVCEIRRDKLPDPAITGNAGSFFMNPIVSAETYKALAAANPGMPHYTLADGKEKVPAGWLIEQCGWKGRRMGHVGVHFKQALVLVNCGGATGMEVLQLCEAIRADVKTKFGIDIKPEVNIV